MTESLQNNKYHFGKCLRCLAVVIIILAIPIAYLAWMVSARIVGFQPPEMAFAQYTPKDVIGDLGGMKVRIPRHYAEYVEYDGDPGFGEKRKGPRPERTFDSRLKSFGISVRFPDMKGLENAQIREEYRRQPLQEKMWIRISINAGEIYPGDGFLDRRTNSVLFNAYSPESKDDWRHGHWNYAYERMPEDEYGLEVWHLTSIDPYTGKPAIESYYTKDIYIHRDPSGNVDAHIRCGRTYVPGGVASCVMGMNLAPKAQVVVNVRFRRGLLPEWKEMQQSVRDLLLSFEVNPSSVSTEALRIVPKQ
ncbi:MAG: hypothetical protein FWD51_01660 [Betaproteobacteria bacterium]|nr:hypothetical protein [Betaproteobacteria bacterium]